MSERYKEFLGADAKRFPPEIVWYLRPDVCGYEPAVTYAEEALVVMRIREAVRSGLDTPTTLPVQDGFDVSAVIFPEQHPGAVEVCRIINNSLYQADLYDAPEEAA